MRSYGSDSEAARRSAATAHCHCRCQCHASHFDRASSLLQPVSLPTRAGRRRHVTGSDTPVPHPTHPGYKVFNAIIMPRLDGPHRLTLPQARCRSPQQHHSSAAAAGTVPCTTVLLPLITVTHCYLSFFFFAFVKKKPFFYYVYYCYLKASSFC
jgi:hypothetical protein